MHCHKPIKQNHTQGFTLVEMVIVMIISAILLTALVTIYTQYRRAQIDFVTKNNIFSPEEGILTRMRNFRSNFNRFPCPADPTLGISNPLFGLEVGSLGPTGPNGLITDPGNCGIDNLTATAGTIPGTGTTPGTGVQVVAAPDGWILIGSLPVQALLRSDSGGNVNSNYDMALDGWGNQFTYAVTLNHTTDTPTLPLPSGATNNDGQIFAQDEFGNPTAGFDPTVSSNLASFAIISHGQNGIGAFSSSGTLVQACAPATNEGANCDNADNRFVQSLARSDVIGTTNAYDDFVYFVGTETAWMWEEIPATAPSTRRGVANVNGGNVGLNFNPALNIAPQEALHVMPFGGLTADIRADNGAQVDQICNDAQTECFDTNIFAGPNGTTCPAGSVFRGFVIDSGGNIAGGVPNCVPINFTNFDPADVCNFAAGEWMIGLRMWAAGSATNPPPGTADILCTGE